MCYKKIGTTYFLYMNNKYVEEYEEEGLEFEPINDKPEILDIYKVRVQGGVLVVSYSDKTTKVFNIGSKEYEGILEYIILNQCKN